MDTAKQCSLRQEASTRGVGVHSGVESRVILRPAVAGSGVCFKVGGKVLPVAPGLVKPSPLCTLLDDGAGASLSTVEHLMSALHALGLDNVLVEVDGPELPILDGSALPWVELIDQAGRVELEAERVWLRVEKGEVVEEHGRVLAAEPDARAGLRLEVHVDFPHPQIGKQAWRGVMDEATYRREIAPARTFVLEKDIAAARAAGFAKGGSLDNAVVFGENGAVLNPGGLRFADEPVRHKVLDAVGDLYMAGRPVWGKFALTMPGHTANNRLLRKIFEVGQGAV
ncbi:MAG: UDP-3-O-[3-hydroxymyristoyl] N-acetylglucosamine deacetylase [Proteobacteria bacterium]|nr:UDP-3-O-[3-hydroxymyristoyl] N-acetylglucosamine deacetylase [Pseudomonadota bacterium]